VSLPQLSSVMLVGESVVLARECVCVIVCVFVHVHVLSPPGAVELKDRVPAVMRLPWPWKAAESSIVRGPLIRH
jgi:hypothetical protein